MELHDIASACNTKMTREHTQISHNEGISTRFRLLVIMRTLMLKMTGSGEIVLLPLLLNMNQRPLPATE